jgi:hypothetical protein
LGEFGDVEEFGISEEGVNGRVVFDGNVLSSPWVEYPAFSMSHLAALLGAMVP